MYIHTVLLDREGIVIADASGLTIPVSASDALKLLRELKRLEGALHDKLRQQQKASKEKQA